MRIRVVRLQPRTPLAGAALAVVALLLLVLVLAFGLALAAGAAAVGGVALLARRVLGRRASTRARPSLDPANEVFLSPGESAARRLPPGTE